MNRKKVLIVDDDSALRDVLAMILDSFGNIDVFEVGDGETAIIKANELSPDLIVMDYKMPGMSGWEAAKYIKQLDTCKRSVIIGYTAWASLDNICLGIENGISEIFTKPIEMDALQRIFRKYLVI